MPQHFLDSSALLKRYRRETGSQWMLDLSGFSDRLVVARLAQVKVTAAIVRRTRNSPTMLATLEPALAAFQREMQETFQVVEFSAALISRALALVRAHALRGADAIQLACALVVRDDLPPGTDFQLVSADDELNAAATAEGLQVENPNLHP